MAASTNVTAISRAVITAERTDAGDPTLPARTWVLISESPDGRWGIGGHATTGDDIIAAARAELGAIAAAKADRE